MNDSQMRHLECLYLRGGGAVCLPPDNGAGRLAAKRIF
jgi:hypothetical protein